MLEWFVTLRYTEMSCDVKVTSVINYKMMQHRSHYDRDAAGSAGATELNAINVSEGNEKLKRCISENVNAWPELII